MVAGKVGTLGSGVSFGLGAFAAMGLFLVGMAAAIGAYTLVHRRGGTRRRTVGIGLGVVAVGCFGVATVFPLLLHVTPVFARPSSPARLSFVSPPPGAVLSGPAPTLRVRLRLEGGRIVPFSSFQLAPDEGHIHLYLDGTIVSMSGLEATIAPGPGRHTLEAEFVAADHGPFRPRVIARVVFDVAT